MDSTMVTLEDRELTAVRGGYGYGGCGFGEGGYSGCGYGEGGFGFPRFGWGGFGLGLDDDCGVETDLDMRGYGCYSGCGW